MELNFMFTPKKQREQIERRKQLEIEAARRRKQVQEEQRAQHELSRDGKCINEYEKLPEGIFLDTSLLETPWPDILKDHFAVILSTQLLDVPELSGLQSVVTKPFVGSPDGDVPPQRPLVTYLLCKPSSLDSRPQLDALSRLKRDRQTSSTQVVVLATSEDVIYAYLARNSTNRSDNEVQSTLTMEKAEEFLTQALIARASDVHIATRGDLMADVHLRINGLFVRRPSISRQLAEQYAYLLYSTYSSDNQRGAWSASALCDTSFELMKKDKSGKPDGIRATVRFNSAPIYPEGNFSLTWRLLLPASASGGVRPIETYGYLSDQLSLAERMVLGGSGLIMMVGPTNSGKSTALQAFARRIMILREGACKVVTIENPVEYEIPGAFQMSAKAENFSDYLKATLRQDPNVVVVGEIRDNEAAAVVQDIVTAGHKILTTLHVRDVSSVFDRLKGLGVPLDVMTASGFMSGIVFQRLLPKLCPQCSRPFSEAMNAGIVSHDLQQRVMSVSSLADHDVRLRNHHGCPNCNHGIIDRMPAAEFLLPDTHYLHLVSEGKSIEAKEYWRKSLGKPISGMEETGIYGTGLGVTALAHGIYLMRQGFVDPRDIEQALEALSSDN